MRYLELLEALLGTINSYAECAQSWNPEKEGDYDEFKQSLLEVLIDHDTQ